MTREQTSQPDQEKPVLAKWLPVIKETLVPLGYFLSEQGEAGSSTVKIVSEPKLAQNLKTRRDFLLHLARENGIIPQGNFIDPTAQVPLGVLLPLLAKQRELAEEDVVDDIIHGAVITFLKNNPSAAGEFADSDEYRDAALAQAARERRELRDHGESAGDDKVTSYEVWDYLWAVLFDAVLK